MVTGTVPALVGFARTLRAAGVPAGSTRVHAWARALGHLDARRTADVYWAGRLTLCAGPDEVAVDDAVFATYFGDLPAGTVRTVRRPVVTVSLPVAIPDGDRPDEPAETGARHVAMTASRVEGLAVPGSGRVDRYRAWRGRPVALCSASVRPDSPHPSTTTVASRRTGPSPDRPGDAAPRRRTCSAAPPNQVRAAPADGVARRRQRFDVGLL